MHAGERSEFAFLVAHTEIKNAHNFQYQIALINLQMKFVANIVYLVSS